MLRTLCISHLLRPLGLLVSCSLPADEPPSELPTRLVLLPPPTLTPQGPSPPLPTTARILCSAQGHDGIAAGRPGEAARAASFKRRPSARKTAMTTAAVAARSRSIPSILSKWSLYLRWSASGWCDAFPHMSQKMSSPEMRMQRREQPLPNGVVTAVSPAPWMKRCCGSLRPPNCPSSSCAPPF